MWCLGSTTMGQISTAYIDRLYQHGQYKSAAELICCSVWVCTPKNKKPLSVPNFVTRLHVVVSVMSDCILHPKRTWMRGEDTRTSTRNNAHKKFSKCCDALKRNLLGTAGCLPRHVPGAFETLGSFRSMAWQHESVIWGMLGGERQHKDPAPTSALKEEGSWTFVKNVFDHISSDWRAETPGTQK